MKGVSPIISTVLLLIISISIGTIFYFWYVSFQRQFQTRVQQESKEKLGEFGYEISVENVFCNSTSNEIIIYIRNTGSNNIPEGEAAVYIYDSNFNLLDSMTVYFSGLNVDEVTSITVEYNITSGNKYYVKVTVPKYPKGDIGWCEAQ